MLGGNIQLKNWGWGFRMQDFSGQTLPLTQVQLCITQSGFLITLNIANCNMLDSRKEI